MQSNASNINIVSSFNEWDPLEEVIVGSVKYAAKMAFEPSINAYYVNDPEMMKFKGSSVPKEEIEKAQLQLDNLANLLQNIGITVRRPKDIDFNLPIKTPDFEVPCQNSSACPRDVLLVIGNEIIEATMSQRARYFEYRAYRSLIKSYFKQGAKWTAAPKPFMCDKTYKKNYSIDETPFDADHNSALTDFEPCFDAASFVRFGKDIFYQPDLVTNDFGAAWLQRHLGNSCNIRRIQFSDKHPPQHIDTTLVPIRPGLVLVNPERPCYKGQLEMFHKNKWKIVKAAPSINKVEFHSPEVSNWISMNFLSIDEKRILVEENELPTIKLLESLGCEVIPCAFRDVYKFGGGIHCCTTDIRRRGGLECYFPKY
ncbi:MAG: hypothetical protein A3F17_08090 [Gammaproteobacteria bacterium RIFCSPHIGHO2_12_FULL_41_15]|nr:MAG: hypothetical protein A3F17_08090 [Gammaproteobacteria bacterium RIFCSPHIGHO2_12_FULL_41_15]